jgi:hypothetical protein
LSTYIVGRKSLSTFDRQNLHYFLADVDRLPLHHERCALLAAAGTMALESFDGELLVDAIGVCDSMREGGGIKELADYFTAVVKRLDVKKKIRDNAAAA